MTKLTQSLNRIIIRGVIGTLITIILLLIGFYGTIPGDYETIDNIDGWLPEPKEIK